MARLCLIFTPYQCNRLRMFRSVLGQGVNNSLL
jgi:hypothetical protein